MALDSHKVEEIKVSSSQPSGSIRIALGRQVVTQSVGYYK